MEYEVAAITKDTILLWDGVTRGPHGQKGGLFTLDIKDHNFKVGQKVSFKVYLASER